MNANLHRSQARYKMNVCKIYSLLTTLRKQLVNCRHILFLISPMCLVCFWFVDWTVEEDQLGVLCEKCNGLHQQFWNYVLLTIRRERSKRNISDWVLIWWQWGFGCRSDDKEGQQQVPEVSVLPWVKWLPAARPYFW